MTTLLTKKNSYQILVEVVDPFFHRKYFIIFLRMFEFYRKAEKVTSMAEMRAIGKDTPGPQY